MLGIRVGRNRRTRFLLFAPLLTCYMAFTKSLCFWVFSMWLVITLLGTVVALQTFDVTAPWLFLGGTSPCCHPRPEMPVGKNGVEWKEASTVGRKMMVFRAGSWQRVRQHFPSPPRASSWVFSDSLTYSVRFKTWPAVIFYLSLVFNGLELIVELTVLASNLLLGTILLTLACHSLSVILTVLMGWTPQDTGAGSFSFVLRFSFLKYSWER